MSIQFLDEFFSTYNSLGLQYFGPKMFLGQTFLTWSVLEQQIFFPQNCFWPKFFLTQNYVGPTISLAQFNFYFKFWTPNFCTHNYSRIQNFWGPNCFWLNLFWTKYFWTQIFVDPKVFFRDQFSEPNIFWSQNYFSPQICVDLNIFWTQKSLRLKIFVNQTFF